MGMVKEYILTTFRKKTWLRVTNRIADGSSKSIDQNGDINEWKRRGFFLTISNTPVLPVDTTKTVSSYLM